MSLATGAVLKRSDTFEEQQQLRQTMSRPEPPVVPYGPDELESSIVDRFERMVEALPDNEVARSTSSSLNYQQLNRQANRIAHAILRLGTGDVIPVGIMIEHGVEMLPALMGILKSGGFYVPLDPAYPQERLEYMVSDSGLSIIVADESNSDLARSLAGKNGEVITIDALDETLPDTNPGIDIEPDRYAYLLYTSGSTGNPKGVIENHRDVKWFTGFFQESDFASQADVITGFWSISFSGLAVSLYLSLLCGATLLLIDPKKVGARRLAELIRTEGVTSMSMGPPLFRQLVDADEIDDGLPLVRLARFGGSGADRNDIDDFFKWARHARLRHSYGMSEVKHIGSYMLASADGVPDLGVPIGYASDGVEILLLDEDGNDVPQGEVGEIIVKSRFVSPGYWNLPEVNEQKIYGQPTGQQERFLRTGDLGVRDENGCLYHRGRKDFQVKLRGYRVELGDVEQALRAVDGVADGAAGVGRNGKVEELVGVIVRSEAYVSPATVRKEMAATLPAYMVPTRYIEVDKLPTTESDKIDRKRLAEMIETSQETNTEAPKGIRVRSAGTEHKLASIWADALRRDSVGLDEDFFEIGGDSLIAAVMVDQIFRVFGKRVPINTLFEAPTVAELAKHIEDLKPRPSPIVPIRPSGSKTPIFCFHSLGGSVLGYYALAQYLPPEYPIWAVQPRGADGTVSVIEKIPDMARHYCDEITRVHEDGEFILTGISLGSMVAFEVARELVNRGRVVKNLVLIDPGSAVPKKPSITSQAWSKAKKLRQSLVYGLAMRRHGRLSPSQARGRIYQNNIRAGRAYRNSDPQPIDVPSSMIRAVYKNEYWVSDENLAGWERLCTGLDMVIEADGAHYGEDYVLEEPFVGEAAEAFLKAIGHQESAGSA